MESQYRFQMVLISLTATAAVALVRVAWAISPDWWACAFFAPAVFFGLWSALMVRKLVWMTGN